MKKLISIIFIITTLTSILYSQNPIDQFLLDPLLRGAGIDPNSEEAEIAKEYGKTWMNPLASDEEIDEDLDRIKNYISNNDRDEDFYNVMENNDISVEEKRSLLFNILGDIKSCPTCSRSFPIDYLFCPYDGQRLAYASEEIELDPFIYFSDLMSRYSLGIKLTDDFSTAKDILINHGPVTHNNSKDATIGVYPEWYLKIKRKGSKVDIIEYYLYEKAGLSFRRDMMNKINSDYGPPAGTSSSGRNMWWRFVYDNHTIDASLHWYYNNDPEFVLFKLQNNSSGF